MPAKLFRAENVFPWDVRTETTVAPQVPLPWVWDNEAAFAALGAAVPVPGYVAFGGRENFAGGVWRYPFGTRGLLTGDATKWGRLLDAAKDLQVEEVVETDAQGTVLAAGGVTEVAGVSLHINCWAGAEPEPGDSFVYEGQAFTVFSVQPTRVHNKVKEMVVTGKRWRGLEGATVRKYEANQFLELI